jgi:hypothetical protein
MITHTIALFILPLLPVSCPSVRISEALEWLANDHRQFEVIIFSFSWIFILDFLFGLFHQSSRSLVIWYKGMHLTVTPVIIWRNSLVRRGGG